MKIHHTKKLYYTISEVSRLLDIKQSVIRYWELKFTDLKPQKNRSGNRIYKNNDINVIKLIRYLVIGEKLSINEAVERINKYKSEKMYRTMLNMVSKEEMNSGQYEKSDYEPVESDGKDRIEAPDSIDETEALPKTAGEKAGPDLNNDKAFQSFNLKETEERSGSDTMDASDPDLDTASQNEDADSAPLFLFGDGHVRPMQNNKYGQAQQFSDDLDDSKTNAEDKHFYVESHIIAGKNDTSSREEEAFNEVGRNMAIVSPTLDDDEKSETKQNLKKSDSVERAEIDRLFTLLEKIATSIREVRDILNE